ncbi:MAG: 50S ribosomal protein L29 [Elusimicrobiota bacterium]
MTLTADELRNKTVEELKSELSDIKKKYMEERFQHASGTLKNPVELKYLRRDIARINTVIKEKNNE